LFVERGLAFCPGWPQTAILSTSGIAGIIDVPPHLAYNKNSKYGIDRPHGLNGSQIWIIESYSRHSVGAVPCSNYLGGGRRKTLSFEASPGKVSKTVAKSKMKNQKGWGHG
jgi:hypothetical protein